MRESMIREALKARVVACLQAGADASGCTMELTWVDNTYADVVDNTPMVEAYVANAARLGRVVGDPHVSGKKVAGSTDMGNVSYLVPSIHPMIQAAPDGVPIHSVDFARYAAGPSGDQAVVDGAKAMAMTIIDLWTSPELRAQVQDGFATRPQGVQVI